MMLLPMNFPDVFEGADRHSQLFQVHTSHPVKVCSRVSAWWWAWKVEMLCFLAVVCCLRANYLSLNFLFKL